MPMGTLRCPCDEHYYVECPAGGECLYCGQPISAEPLSPEELAALDSAAMYGDEPGEDLTMDPYDVDGGYLHEVQP